MTKSAEKSISAAISGTRLASLLGITRRRVDQLAEDGILDKHDEGFDLDKSVRAYCAWLRRDDETKAERRQLLAAQTLATRLRAQRSSGALLTRAEVRRKLEPLEVEMLAYRAVAGWLRDDLTGKVDDATRDRLAHDCHHRLCLLIAATRDRLAKMFADVVVEELEDGMVRLNVPGQAAG